MAQISTSLPKEMIVELQNIANSSDKSFSNVVKLMIEYGLEVHKKLQGDEGKKKEDLEAKTTEYIIRIFGITSEVLRCVYDQEKSKHKEENAEKVLLKIEKMAQNFLSSEQ